MKDRDSGVDMVAYNHALVYCAEEASFATKLENLVSVWAPCAPYLGS